MKTVLPIDELSLDRLSSPFGVRVHPISKARSFHYGLDFAYPKGTKVRAFSDGVVTVAKMQQGGKGLGLYVTIKHENYYTMYAHLSSRYVSVGDKVTAGTVIGEVGSTGDSTGNHLHFGMCSLYVSSSVNKSNWYDPLPYIKEILEDNEVVKDGKIIVNATIHTVSLINKDGTNYIRLRDLEKIIPNTKVSYSKTQKLPEVKMNDRT